MRIDEAKVVLLEKCASETSDVRAAIEALPDRRRLDRLDPLARSLIETCLFQLVTLEVVS
jgi:hypothetical protein